MDSSSKNIKLKDSPLNSKGAKKKTPASELSQDVDRNSNSVGLIHPEALKLLNSIEKSEKPLPAREQKVEKSKSVQPKNRKQPESQEKDKQQSGLVFDPHDWQNAKGIDLNKLLDNDSQATSSKKAQKAQEKKNDETQRNLRSTRKYKHFSQNDKGLSDFSIDSIDWYYLNEKSYKAKLYTVLSDFTIDKPNRREGNAKLSYNYLLLDLRKRSSRSIDWNNFINAIFYIGKGKNNRAYDHTKEAEAHLKKDKRSSSKKINKILEIWNDDSPVMVLKISQDIIAEEALTREAFMIDAIGKKRLCNVQDGTYYGVASTMTPREKREMGTTLLVEARETLIKSGADSVYPKNSTKRDNALDDAEKEESRLGDIIASLLNPYGA